MVKVKRQPQFLDRVKRALVDDLKAVGIVAEVESEPIPTTKLHRLMVLAPKFKSLKHYERQELVWRITEKTLAPEDQLKVIAILTLTDAPEGFNSYPGAGLKCGLDQK